MKNSKLILSAIVALVFFTCCNEKDEEPDIRLKKSTISPKWMVNNQDEYVSFEFNEAGNYIVVRDSSDERIIRFGTFEITGNSNVKLNGFGTFKVSELTDQSFRFCRKF